MHFNSTEKLDKDDKLTKVRPLITMVNQNLIQYGCFCENISIDEQMLPYHGNHHLKQFIKNKPVRFGYKAWATACQHGYPFNFDIYQGKNTRMDLEKEYDGKYGNIGCGGEVVFWSLNKVVTYPEEHKTFIDNYFTSYALLRHLQDNGFRCTGTMRANRTSGCPIPSKADCSKQTVPRGTMDYASDGNICIVQWKDNAPVIVGTNWSSVTPLENITRRSKNERQQIQMPHMIKFYNQCMGGVDVCDRHISHLRIKIRKKCWYWPIVKHCFEVLRVASFVFYNHLHPTSPMTQKNFTRALVQNLLVSRHLPVQITVPKVEAWLTTTSQGRCSVCKSNTTKQCGHCNVRLHKKCACNHNCAADN